MIMTMTRKEMIQELDETATADLLTVLDELVSDYQESQNLAEVN